MSVTQKVTLYNNKFTVPPVINAVQNDTDRLIEAYFGDFTLQVGMTGVLSFIRSDRTHYEVSATLDPATNTATAELDQALTQAGVTQAQLKITDSGNVGSTFTFMIKVQPDVAGISVEQDGWSAEEFNERLTTAEQNISDLAEEVETDYAKQVGSYDGLSVGTASGLVGKSGETDTVPYTYRAILHDSTREVMRKIVGATVGWNQLAYNNQTATLSMPDRRTINISTNSKPSVVDHVYLYSCIITEDTTVGGLNAQYSINVNFGQGAGVKAKISRCTSPLSYIYVYIGSGESSGVSLTYKDFNAIDLTAMLGTTIADYVYGLETATAGAGVAWLKSHFPKAFNEYQPYDAGSLKSVGGLVSHDTVGFNQWDEEWELGVYDISTGQPVESNYSIRGKNRFAVVPNTSYYANNNLVRRLYYDADDNFISAKGGIGLDTTPSNCAYMRIYLADVYGTTYKNDICINLSDPQRNGQYEPYQKHSYPLDPTQELRGIFKLDSANNLYADGDEWYADGRKNVRYGIVDLGSLTWNIVTSGTYNRFYSTETNIAKPASSQSAVANVVSDRYVSDSFSNLSTTDKAIAINTNGAINVTDSAYATAAAFKTAMSGVKIVVELATPTESTAPSFADIQIIDSDGTEEFVTDCIVAVGNETFYADDLVGKLDDLPALPTTAGTYRLKVTVTAGVPSYEWIAT